MLVGVLRNVPRVQPKQNRNALSQGPLSPSNCGKKHLGNCFLNKGEKCARSSLRLSSRLPLWASRLRLLRRHPLPFGASRSVRVAPADLVKPIGPGNSAVRQPEGASTLVKAPELVDFLGVGVGTPHRRVSESSSP